MPSVKFEMDMMMVLAFKAGWKAGRKSQDPAAEFAIELDKFMRNPESYRGCGGCGKEAVNDQT